MGGGDKAERASSSNAAGAECLWSRVCCLRDITQELSPQCRFHIGLILVTEGILREWTC